MFHAIPPPSWCLLAAALCSAAVPAALAGETPAPQYISPTDDLAKGFLDPPASAKPSVYWWWLFNRVDKKGITRDLEEFKAKGIGGVNLICTGGYAGDHPLPGVKFLGPEWRELFRHALREAARLKIEIGFNMAGGWVMMGPWVTQDDAMKKIVQSELKLKGPQKFSGQLPQPTTVDGYYRDVMVQAFRSREKTAAIDPKQIIDITDRWRADKTFQWDVPAGEWAILRTGYTLTGSKWEPYPLGDTFAGGAGYQIDCMNRSSLRNYFDFLGRIVLDEARRAGGRLAYLWADSWESGKLTWTQDFAAEFRKYRGYDLTPYLPAISGYTVLNADVTARFRADFDRTIADCVAENFYGEFARLCHENGVEMRSEAAGPGDNPPIDALRNLGRCDVPAGEFWVNGHFGAPGGWNSSPGLRGNLKQTSSAAHVYGKRIAQAEAFTQQEPDRTHWSLGPGDLKPYADNAFCEGINYFMLHQATCQLSTDGRPGYEFCAGQHWNPSITWWDQSAAFFAYLARCQFLLQQGRFVGDICYYLGEEPPMVAPFKQHDVALRGYDGDYCNSEVLLTRMSVKDGRLVLPDGMSYRVLVLQNCTSTSRQVCDVIGGSVQQAISNTPSTAMSLGVLKKIGQLVHDGATVVGAKPQKAVGLKNYPQCDEAVKKLADEIWGDCDGKTHTEHTYGKGRVVWGEPLGFFLRTRVVGPDFRFYEPHDKSINPKTLDFIHRATGDADIYFFSNRSNQPQTLDCAFRVLDRQPEIWDPVSGTIRDAAAFQELRITGHTWLSLKFAPFESFFVVFREPIYRDAVGPLERDFPNLSSAQDLTGPWTVHFDPRWGGPESIEFPELVSWTKRPEPGIKFYSGKATYHKKFDLDPKAAATIRDGSQLFLDLGGLKHVAEVRLNGRKLGTLWTAPWRVEITAAVRPANNDLEIDVVNLWVNRVVGDLNLPKEKRITQTHDVFRFGMVRPTTPLLDSGLFGPVTLQAEEKEPK
ncbi:MAG: glycosyl hydrolase [Thermoguttaceae bacterium]